MPKLMLGPGLLLVGARRTDSEALMACLYYGIAAAISDNRDVTEAARDVNKRLSIQPR